MRVPELAEIGQSRDTIEIHQIDAFDPFNFIAIRLVHSSHCRVRFLNLRRVFYKLVI
jgi:hypothetical protein